MIGAMLALAMMTQWEDAPGTDPIAARSIATKPAPVESAAAQSPPDQSSSAPTKPPVVVTAPGKKPRTTYQVLRDVVGAAGSSEAPQIARYDKPICPGVIGGTPTYATSIVTLIRANIKAVGAPLGGPGCVANAYLVLSPEADKVTADFLKSQHGLREILGQWRVDKLMRPGVEIRSFQAIMVKGSSGEILNETRFNTPVQNTPAFGSRIITPVQQTVFVSLAILDAKAIVGKTRRQVADLATMHLLLDIRPDAGDKAADSILSLFHDPAPPPRMTAVDRGMLAGLYGRTQGSRSAHFQRKGMAREIALEQEREKATTPPLP